MDSVRFHTWELECDPEATRKAYNQLPPPREYAPGLWSGPILPGMVCQDFSVAREEIYPPEVRDLFGSLGIDQRKEAMVIHLGGLGQKPASRTDFPPHIWWFHFIGSIAAGVDSYRPIRETVHQDAWSGTVRTEPLNETLSLGFTNRAEAVREPFRGHPVAQVSFQARVPMVSRAPVPPDP